MVGNSGNNDRSRDHGFRLFQQVFGAKVDVFVVASIQKEKGDKGEKVGKDEVGDDFVRVLLNDCNRYSIQGRGIITQVRIIRGHGYGYKHNEAKDCTHTKDFDTHGYKL